MRSVVLSALIFSLIMEIPGASIAFAEGQYQDSGWPGSNPSDPGGGAGLGLGGVGAPGAGWAGMIPPLIDLLSQKKKKIDEPLEGSHAGNNPDDNSCVPGSSELPYLKSEGQLDNFFKGKPAEKLYEKYKPNFKSAAQAFGLPLPVVACTLLKGGELDEGALKKSGSGFAQISDPQKAALEKRLQQEIDDGVSTKKVRLKYTNADVRQKDVLLSEDNHPLLDDKGGLAKAAAVSAEQATHPVDLPAAQIPSAEIRGRVETLVATPAKGDGEQELFVRTVRIDGSSEKTVSSKGPKNVSLSDAEIDALFAKAKAHEPLELTAEVAAEPATSPPKPAVAPATATAPTGKSGRPGQPGPAPKPPVSEEPALPPQQAAWVKYGKLSREQHALGAPAPQGLYLRQLEVKNPFYGIGAGSNQIAENLKALQDVFAKNGFNGSDPGLDGTVQVAAGHHMGQTMEQVNESYRGAAGPTGTPNLSAWIDKLKKDNPEQAKLVTNMRDCISNRPASKEKTEGVTGPTGGETEAPENGAAPPPPTGNGTKALPKKRYPSPSGLQRDALNAPQRPLPADKQEN